MACRWIENPSTGKWEQVCDGGTTPSPTPNPTPAPQPVPSGDVWGWPTVKPRSEVLTGQYDSIYTFNGKSYQHKALDIAGDPEGTLILAPHSGKVVIAGWDNSGYGNLVKIVFDNYSILLGHLASITVKDGQTVNVGDVVGTMGSTGNSTGRHLHFEVRQGSGVIDPMQFFGGNPKAGTPGNRGETQPTPAPAPKINPDDFVPIAPDKNGKMVPTDPTNPLAKMGWKQPDGTYAWASDAPSRCIDIWRKEGWEAGKNCYLDWYKNKVSQVTGMATGAIGEQIVSAIRAAFSIPDDPEEQKYYAARWIVGGIAMLILLLALYALISMNREAKNLVREYVGTNQTSSTIQRLKELVSSNGKEKS